MGDIQQQAQMAGLFDGSLSSCEAELQELMHQIDIMVNSKRLEWETSIKSTEAQLRQREEELTTMKMNLDLKTAESKRLTHELAGMGRTQKELVSQYEHQVDQLRRELNALQKSYEKLERHHSKQGDGVERAKEVSEAQLRKTRVDLRMAESTIAGYEGQAREWDIQRRAFRQQVEGLESQRQKLAETCHALQQDNAAYKHQLGKRQQILDQSDLDFKTRIVHVEGQLQRAQDTLDGKNSTIQRLEEFLEEAGQRKCDAEGENRHLLEDVGRKEHQLHMLESEVSTLQQEIEDRDGTLQATKKEFQEQVANHECKLLAQKNMLRSHEDETRKRSLEVSEETLRLRNQLQDSQRKIGDLVESEARLKTEVSRLENRLDIVQGDNAALNVELTDRIKELRRLENDARSHQANEKQENNGLERHMEAELVAMRQEVETLTGALAQRNAAVETLSAQLAGVKHRLTAQTTRREKESSELQIANAEVDALRVENRSLRAWHQHPRTASSQAPDKSERDTGDGQTLGMVNGSRWQVPAKTDHSQTVDVHLLQSQLQAIQRQLRMVQTMDQEDPSIADGSRHERHGSGTGTKQHPQISRRSTSSPARTSVRPVPDLVRIRTSQSPIRTGPSLSDRSGSLSSRNSPARVGPNRGKTANGATHYDTMLPVRNLPEGTDEWQASPETRDSDGLHSLETGSILTASNNSPSQSPPTYDGFHHKDSNLDDSEVTSLNVTGLSELGLHTDAIRANRPPSRESVGTRFLLEDQKHQEELERILNAHIQDLDLRTTQTLAKHSQRQGKGNGET